MIKPMTCPKCGANIQIDNSNEYGFCSYCGTKIQLRDVVEVKHSGTLEIDGIAGFNQLLENGNAYLKFKDFGKAERTYKQAVENFPAKIDGYVGLITAYARNFEEDNLYSYNQIESLLEQMRLIEKDEDNIDSFVEKAEAYCTRQKKKCELNNLNEQFVSIDNSINSNKGGLVVIALILVLLVYFVFNSVSYSEGFVALIVLLGMVEVGLFSMHIMYKKQSVSLLARIQEIEAELDDTNQKV